MSAGLTQGRVSRTRFHDPVTLARISNLALLARTVVDGFVAGVHHARHHGSSTNFAEYRAYAAGDDVRHVDWRLYARTDRLYVKTYEAETTADVTFALDVSGSMAYGSGEITKLDYARMLVACLGELAFRQRDRSGLATFRDALLTHSPPRQTSLGAFAQHLESAAAAGPGDLESGLEAVAGQLRRRGMVVVVSDFYLEPERAATALAKLRSRGQDVLALHVANRYEESLGFEGPVVLEDAETAERLPIVPGPATEQYHALFAAHVAELTARCGAHGVDYAPFYTYQPLDGALFRYLSVRASRERRR